MKKVLLSHSLLYIAISVFIGYFIGCDIVNDFFDLYAGKLLLLPVRYTLLLLIVAVSNLLGNVFMNSAIVVREKNFLKNDDKLVLLASHNTDDLRQLCDKIYKIENGRITGEIEL